MSFMNLLVFADDTDASTKRLKTAIAMAERHGGQLAACVLAEQPSYYYGVGTEVAADIYLADVERIKAMAQETADAVRTRLASSDRDGGTRWATGTSGTIAEIAARDARYADFNLIGQPVGEDRKALLSRILEGVLFDSGRPCAIVPQGWGGAFGKRIMVAWAPCKEAARAVSDAMPLIETAEAVHIAMVDPRTGEDGHGDEPGADLAASLARHRANVTVDALPSAGHSTAERLLLHAADCGADLIVMGGYGHWRLSEALFGGVTREMVRSSQIPLMLAH